VDHAGRSVEIGLHETPGDRTVEVLLVRRPAGRPLVHESARTGRAMRTMSIEIGSPPRLSVTPAGGRCTHRPWSASLASRIIFDRQKWRQSALEDPEGRIGRTFAVHRPGSRRVRVTHDGRPGAHPYEKRTALGAIQNAHRHGLVTCVPRHVVMTVAGVEPALGAVSGRRAADRSVDGERQPRRKRRRDRPGVRRHRRRSAVSGDTRTGRRPTPRDRARWLTIASANVGVSDEDRDLLLIRQRASVSGC